VSETIHRSVDDVFEVLTHIENNPRWSSMVIDAEQTSPGRPGVGTTGTTTGKFLGMTMLSELVITEFVPGAMFAYRSTAGPVTRWGRVTFEDVGGTKVTITVGGDQKGFFKVTDPILVRVGKRQLKADLATLKELMESGAL
jgi:uncharacterized membrane protein